MNPTTSATPRSPKLAVEDAIAASFRDGLGRMVLRFGLLVLAGFIVDALLGDESAPTRHDPPTKLSRVKPRLPHLRHRAPGGSATPGLRLHPRSR